MPSKWSERPIFSADVFCPVPFLVGGKEASNSSGSELIHLAKESRIDFVLHLEPVLKELLHGTRPSSSWQVNCNALLQVCPSSEAFEKLALKEVSGSFWPDAEICSNATRARSPLTTTPSTSSITARTGFDEVNQTSRVLPLLEWLAYTSQAASKPRTPVCVDAGIRDVEARPESDPEGPQS
jgi:hypothetical protein